MRKSITKSRLTKKSQVTIPWVVREKLGVKPGDQVEFVFVDKGKEVHVAPARSLADKFYGAGKKYAKNKPPHVDEVEYALGQEAKEVAKEGLE